MPLNFTEEDDKIYSSNESLDDISDDYNQQLRNRINQLRGTMLDLKAQLKDEKDSWEKEIQHISTSESNNQIRPDIITVNNDMSNTNLLQGLSMYEDPMDYINVESKNLQRQLAISNYRRRLLEVENMCNLELMRVKQNVTFLQPLRMMASEWDSSKEPGGCGECLYPTPKSGDYYSPEEDDKLHELPTPLEIMSNKYAGDMTTFSKLSAESHGISCAPNKMYYQTDEKRFHSRSATWCNDYLTTE